jgi:UDPglucose--hexose-1-phosphate uridylyltransferase
MPELRQNPATKEWVIISTERAKRPEEFGMGPVKEASEEIKNHCPFCEGNESLTPPEILAFRTYGTKPNSSGWWLRVIPNAFPALVPQGSSTRVKDLDFFNYMPGLGEHEVIIESPKHDLHIATMKEKQVAEIFLAYRERYVALCCDPKFELITIFKNHGKSAGTSIKHPHSQLIATPITPSHMRHRVEEAMRFFDDSGRCVHCVMIEKEQKFKERVVLETDNFIVFEPFASRSPFETAVLPKKHGASYGEITPELSKELAFTMKKTLEKICKGLNNPDYNYMITSSPCHESNEEYFHWHIMIVPRVAAVAGFELGSGIYINTVIPEKAAKYLREINVQGP